MIMSKNRSITVPEIDDSIFLKYHSVVLQGNLTSVVRVATNLS